MERQSVLIYRLNKYCDYDHSSKHSLQIQCNHYQNTNNILLRNRKKNHPKIYMGPEKFWTIRIFSKKKNIGEFAKVNLKIHYSATVINESGADTETDMSTNRIKWKYS